MPSCEEMRKAIAKINQESNEREQYRHAEQRKRLESTGQKPFDYNQVPPQRCDHPNTMEDGTATVLWIVAMIISLLFKGGWVLCILETIIWFKFITRYR